jgi:hypothetical protein
MASPGFGFGFGCLDDLLLRSDTITTLWTTIIIIELYGLDLVGLCSFPPYRFNSYNSGLTFTTTLESLEITIVVYYYYYVYSKWAFPAYYD